MWRRHYDMTESHVYMLSPECMHISYQLHMSIAELISEQNGQSSLVHYSFFVRASYTSVAVRRVAGPFLYKKTFGSLLLLHIFDS